VNIEGTDSRFASSSSLPGIAPGADER